MERVVLLQVGMFAFFSFCSKQLPKILSLEKYLIVEKLAMGCLKTQNQLVL